MASSTRTPCYPLSNRRTRAKSPPGASGIPSAMYTRPKTKSSHGRWHPSWRMNHDGQYWLNWNSLDLLSAAGKYHIQAWLKRLRLLLNVYCPQNCRDLLTAAKFDSSFFWTHPDHLRSLGCIFFRKWIQSLPCFGCQVAGNQLTKWKGKTVFFIGPSKKFKSTLWEIQSHYSQLQDVTRNKLHPKQLIWKRCFLATKQHQIGLWPNIQLQLEKSTSRASNY